MKMPVVFFPLQNPTSADKNLDDGEIDKVEFDASKFIEYPGFNATVPSNLIDVRASG